MINVTANTLLSLHHCGPFFFRTQTMDHSTPHTHQYYEDVTVEDLATVLILSQLIPCGSQCDSDG